MRNILWVLLFVSLHAFRPARPWPDVFGQLPPQPIYLPEIVLRDPFVSGMPRSLVTSRLAPGLGLLVVGPPQTVAYRYDLLISRNHGLGWEHAGSQPWQTGGLAPWYRLGDMLTPGILRENDTLVLIVAPGWLPDLYVSEDLGRSWITRPLPSDSTCDSGLSYVHAYTTPAAPTRIWLTAECNTSAGSQFGLWTSADIGRTWTALQPWTPVSVDRMGAPVLSATVPELAYRADGQGWIRSLDGGLTWVPVNVPGDTLTIGPDDPAILLTGSRATGVVSASVDAAASWRPVATPDCGALQLNTPLTLLRGAPRTALAVCATGSLVRSLDLGRTWSTLPAIGGRFQVVVSDDGAAGRLLGWAGVEPDDGKHAQLVVSADAGDTWMPQLDFMAAP